MIIVTQSGLTYLSFTVPRLELIWEMYQEMIEFYYVTYYNVKQFVSSVWVRNLVSDIKGGT
jgi:hypothetical protein